MTEIYWITRLCILEVLCEILAHLSGIALIISCVFVTCADKKDDEKIWCQAVKAAKVSGIVFFITLMGVIFVPGKRDLMLIYGVGGTIDYVKQNPTAQQLPDKVVKALDAWLDEKSKE